MMPPRDAIHPWKAHLDGLRAIIQVRNNNNIGRLRDSNRLAQNDVDTSSTNEGRSPLDELRHDLGDLRPYADLQTAGAALHMLVGIVQPVFRPASYLLDNPDRSARKEVEYLQTTLSSHLPRLKRWPAALSDDWRPKPLHYAQSGDQALPLDLYQGRVDIYPDCQRSSTQGLNLG
jgi:hypothetical protein